MSHITHKSPVPFTDETPRFEIPEWKSLGADELSAGQMSRHFLILGETGSGKTQSGVMPLLKAALLYDPNQARASLKPAMLIIDPKFELATFTYKILQASDLDRIVKLSLTKYDHRIDFFEGVDKDNITSVGIVDRIGHIFAGQVDSRNPFWEASAQSLIERLVNLDLYFWRRRGREDFWIGLANYIKDNRPPDMYLLRSGDSASSQYDQFADTVLHREIKRSDDNYFLSISAFISVASTYNDLAFWYLEKYCRHKELPASHWVDFANYRYMGNETFTGIIAYVHKWLRLVTDAEINRHMSFLPYEIPGSAFLSIIDSMNEGKILLFSPGEDDSSIGVSIAKAIKAKFFELTFKRDNQERPVVYVCDEFQRFITNDPVSGEQSFLDRCRAFRAICVLATQGLSSLSYALSQHGRETVEDSINILMTNTGNKIFFRNTDSAIQRKLNELIPTPSVSDKPHLISVRPASTLAVGECYFLLSTGKWGRKRMSIID